MRELWQANEPQIDTYIGNHCHTNSSILDVIHGEYPWYPWSCWMPYIYIYLLVYTYICYIIVIIYICIIYIIVLLLYKVTWLPVSSAARKRKPSCWPQSSWVHVRRARFDSAAAASPSLLAVAAPLRRHGKGAENLRWSQRNKAWTHTV